LEKLPADTLPKPSEKTPTQPPEAQRLFPTSLSDIEAMVSRITGTVRPTPSDTGKPDSNTKTPAAVQQR
jgi:hypothetical protein